MRIAQALRIRSGKTSWALSMAVGAVGIGVGLVGRADAAAVDVLLSRTVASSPSVITTLNPAVTIPDAPGVTYDAADVTDSGTIWNSLMAPNAGSAQNDQTGSPITFPLEQNLPLVDSGGNPTNISLASITFTEANGKNDTIHNQQNNSANTDLLPANPLPLMNQSWLSNSTSETINFNLTGLTPGGSYLLYLYGAGTVVGDGGGFTLAAANQPVGYAEVSTEPNASAMYRSVFDSTGINPIPELGLSWNLLPAVADTNGDLSFSVAETPGTKIKGSINGFQLDTVTVPEPTSLGIVAFGAMALLGRRRK